MKKIFRIGFLDGYWDHNETTPRVKEVYILGESLEGVAQKLSDKYEVLKIEFIGELND